MKKIIISSFIFICTFAIGLNGALTIPNNAQKIECQIQPVAVTQQGPNIPKSIGAGRGRSSFPNIPTGFSTSANWSGYVAARSLKHPECKAVSSVSGYWTVPQLNPSPNDAFCGIWVGIDGYKNSPTVEQIGTAHNWIGGAQTNYAWFEMYPEQAFIIAGFPVNIGDVIGAEVSYIGNHTFQLTIHNVTQSLYTTIPPAATVSYFAKRNTAEWIVEAPSMNSQIQPLSNYGSVIFSNCSTTIQGRTGSINSGRWNYNAITMSKTQGVAESVPSTLGFGGTSFSASWQNQ